MAVAEVRAPAGGIWRVARGGNPFERPPHLPRTNLTKGNRFDPLTLEYDVLYFGTDLETCFGETLARFRPNLDLVSLVEKEWDEFGFMALGTVAADWRHRRTAGHLLLPDDCLFLDVEAPETHQVLRKQLALGLSALGCKDLDVSTVRGPDRRVTQLISEWTYAQERYAGIRYFSRLHTGWECWAVFYRTIERLLAAGDLEVVETVPITEDMPALLAVAELFELRVF